MATWTKETPNTAEWDKQTAQTPDFDKGLGFLLNILSGYILQENGGRIILQESWNYQKPITWTKELPNESIFTNEPIHSADWD